MKKIAALTATAALAATAVIAAPPASATVNEYVAFVRSEMPNAVYVPRYKIVKMGRMVCASLDSGADPYELGEMAVQSGFSDDEAAVIVVGAIVFICPRHQWMID